MTLAARGIAPRGRLSATDALLGVAVLLLCLGAAGAGTLDGLRLPSTLEHAAYDYGLSLRADPLPTDRIVIVGIDHPSIELLGPWPWPRSTLAQVVETVSAGRPNTIGLWEPLSEPNPSPAIPELETIRKNVVQRAQALTKVKELRALRKRVLAQIRQPAPSSKPGTKSSDHDLRFLEEIYATLLKELRSAQKRLDHDRTISRALKQGPFVVVPMRVRFGQPADRTQGPLPDWAVAQALNVDASEAAFSAVQSVAEIALPLPRFVHAGVGVGHMALSPDGDGVLRMDTVAVRSGSHLWPSFALRMVAASSRIPMRDILVEPGQQVSLGEHRILVDERLRTRIQFSRNLANVPTYSAFK
ncbi:MAG: CHASE2 domain-containing protein, partial [bacterium]